MACVGRVANTVGMTTNTAPTYAELRLALAKERLAHAETLAKFNMLHASTVTVSAPVYLPGPRWNGAEH